MREISEATLAILKSQNLTGQNRFSHSLKLEGTEYYTDIKEVKTNDVNSVANAADMVIRADGKVLFAYNIGLDLYLKVVDSENDFMSVPNTANDGILFHTVRASLEDRFYSLMRLKNGKLLLFINDIGNISDGTKSSLKCFESANGLGDDFILKSTLVNIGRKNSNNLYMRNLISKGGQTEDGTIFLAACIFGGYISGLDLSYFNIFKSTDNGASWSSVYEHDGGAYYFVYNKNLRNLTVYKNVIICTTLRQDQTFGVNAYISTDFGATWGFANDNFSNLPMSNVIGSHKHLVDFYCGKDGILYMILNDVDTYHACSVYKMTKTGNITYNDINNMANWDLIQSGIYMNYTYQSTFYTSPRGNIHHLVSTGELLIKDVAMIRDEYSADLNASSISISKGKGGSNTATIQASNKDGILNPKNPESPLFGILGTNKQIIIKQGYGEEIVETFTGMIDDFDMSTWPQTTGIALRDNLKKALDQTITNGTQHTIEFISQPIENIVGYLCYLANIDVGVDAIEPTDISVAMNFSWCSYADAFQQLGDLASFEWGCDSYGKFYFRRDYQPDNMFVAYTFEEGIDLATLKYKISDKDLYSKVVVFGKSGDNVISYEAPFLDAALYNILPQKILKIDATEANTVGALRKIAERSLSMMQSRTAVINFESIAIPWLEPGDFIGIYERSTGAASIYRLSDLSFSMDKDSFKMSGTAYYYGDSIVPGELPTDVAAQTVAPTINLIPEMTSNIAPSGVARASSVYTSNYEPWQAFNSHSDDYYWNSITNTGWIEYQFPEKTIVDKYMLKARQLTIYNDAMPRDFTFEGFDGEKWVVLDRQTGQTNWGVYQSRTYKFTNIIAYSKYRLNVSRNDGYMRLQLEQLAMYYGGGA